MTELLISETKLMISSKKISRKNYHCIAT